MAFNQQAFSVLVQTFAGSTRIYCYDTTDSPAEVTAAGYIQASSLGLRDGELVVVRFVGTSEVALYSLTDVSGTSATLEVSAEGANHTHPIADIVGLQAALDSKQLSDATLTALAGLTGSAGLIEQIGADTFAKRVLGVGASTSVPTRADADARYLLQSDYTANDVLEKLLTVDGPGSDLDADTLDGVSAADFALANHVHEIADITDLDVGLAAKLDDSQLTTDATFASNSDTLIPSQKAIKTYVDSASAGLHYTIAARVATTAAITLATGAENGDTIDGVALATGDRILIKNQASAIENGVYTVNASGAPTRGTDADAGSELVGLAILITAGTVNTGSQWQCSNVAAPTVGVDNITFIQIAFPTPSYTAGTGLALVGNVFSVGDAELLALAGLTSAADKMPYFTGSGTATTATVTTFARTILDDTTQAAVRTTLALTPGTNVQAFDATLTGLAALNATATGLVEQTTGSNIFTQRAMGVAASTSIPTRADADARYLLQTTFVTTATLTTLAALATGGSAYLLDPLKSGMFFWSAANLVSEVTNDPQQAVYVPPTGQSGTTGAWVRQFDIGVKPEWFGAIGDGDYANMAADTKGVQKAIDFSSHFGPPVLMGEATYIIDGHKGDNVAWTNTAEWKSGGVIVRSGARIWGAGIGKTIVKNGADRWRCVFRIREQLPISIRDMTVDGNVSVSRRPVMLGGDGLETLTEGDVRGECFIFEGESVIDYFELKNLRIQNSGHYGIGIQNVKVVGGHIDTCIFSNIGGDCIDVKAYAAPSNYKRGMLIQNILSLDGAGHHYLGKYDVGEGHVDQTVVDLAEGCHLHGCFVYDLALENLAGISLTGVRFRPIGDVRTGSPFASASLIRVYSSMPVNTGNNDTNNVCCVETTCDGSHMSDIVTDGGYRGVAVIVGAEGGPLSGSITDATIRNVSWDGVGEPAYGLRIGGSVKGIIGRNIIIQKCVNGAKLDCTECDINMRIEDSTTLQLRASEAVMAQNEIKVSFSRANVTPSNGDFDTTISPQTSLNQVAGVSPLAASFGGQLHIAQSRRAYLNLISSADNESWTGTDAILGGIQAIGADTSGAGPGVRAAIRCKTEGGSGSTYIWEMTAASTTTNDVAAFRVSGTKVSTLLPLMLHRVTLAELATLAPSTYTGGMVFVDDAPVGKPNTVTSDGVSWRYTTDEVAI